MSFVTEFGSQQKDRLSGYQVRQNLALFRNLVALILNWNCVKSLIVPKIVQKNKFEEDWGELEARNCFQRQSWTNFMRETLVFKWNSTIRENFKFFQQFSGSIKKILGLEGRLGTRLYFYQVFRFSWSFLIGLFLDSDFVIAYHIPLVGARAGRCIDHEALLLLCLGVLWGSRGGIGMYYGMSRIRSQLSGKMPISYDRS